MVRNICVQIFLRKICFCLVVYYIHWFDFLFHNFFFFSFSLIFCFFEIILVCKIPFFLYNTNIFFLKKEIFRNFIQSYFLLNAKNIFIYIISNYESMFTYLSINIYQRFYFMFLNNLTFY